MTKENLPKYVFSDEKFLSFRDKITYYTKKIDSYNCYIFVCELEDLSQLENSWDIVNEEMAANFQSQLEIEIDLWNLYIIFMVNDYVPKEVKYKIEQDKYSSRKIVFDYLVLKRLTSDTDIVDIINNKLFSLKSKISVTNNLETSKDLILKTDRFVIDALLDYKLGNKIESFYANFLQKKYGK